jgi:hypothetical protein
VLLTTRHTYCMISEYLSFLHVKVDTTRSHLELCLLLLTEGAVLAEVNRAPRYTCGGPPRQDDEPRQGPATQDTCHLGGAHEQGGEEPAGKDMRCETREGLGQN